MLIRAILTAVILAVATAAGGEQPSVVGYAHMFSNDFLGDGKDRWHTGSLSFSILTGRPRPSALSFSGLEDVMEYRFRSEIISPSNLVKPATSDRPYAGILSFGIHRHLKKDGLETSLGLDLVAVGNQTGLLDLQRGFHNIFGIGSFDAVPQIGDAVYPTISAELAKPIDLSNSVWIRPFVEAQAGAETFVRAGVDLEFGSVRKKLFTVRDVTTGQLIPSHVRGVSEFSVVSLGLDLARVFDSYYLPSSSGLIHYKERPRVRVGIYRGGRSGTFFYGLTWLGKEFKGQPEGQVIGSVSMNLRF